jgi:hypothetical protein
MPVSLVMDRGILKQYTSSPKGQVVRYHPGVWNATQQDYSTIKKEILSIVLCIWKFQDDLLNSKKKKLV